MSEKKLFLLDGHALVYRAHYAFINRPLINSKGLNTSAITGFVRTLWDLMKKQNPSHLAVSFDLPGPTFRHERYPLYKANREAQPEDITTALPHIKEIIQGFNIPIVELEGFEADDVIGTLSKQAEKEGFKVFMVTPDKDYAQLVSENIFMYKPARSGNDVEILGVPEVLEKWQIKNVLQVIDVLGLQGDSVDNIPGIPGIGAKTAVKLLAIYDDVETLIKNTDQLKGKQKENVENFAEQGMLSKELATININAPIQFNADAYKIENFDKDRLAKIFKELEFRTLATSILGVQPEGTQTNLFGDAPANPKANNPVSRSVPAPTSYQVVENSIENTKHNYTLVDTAMDRAELISKLEKQKAISFDTETTGIDANIAELVGIAFSFKKGEAFYVPVPDKKEEAIKICAEFKGVLENPNIIKVGQNIKYDLLMLKWYGINVQGEFFDTMIAHYLCEPDLRHRLEYLSETMLKYKMVSITELIGKAGKNQLSMRDIDVEKVKEYAGEDADITWQVKTPLEKKLKENKAGKLYKDIELPLINVLASMEYEGVRIDSDFLNNYSKELAKEIEAKQKTIYKKAGTDFNIASPKQVGEVLFDRLKIPYRWRKTSSGQYSTDVTKLNELAVKNEIVQEILDFSKFAKLKSTYVDALPNMVNPRTGRIHTNYNQTRAATGRLSSENPNLQNIPIKDAAGREIRKAFKPRDENYILLASDYSQVELRLIAEISKDEAMLDAFIKGQDFHKATAARVFNTPFEEVTADQRRQAKTVNFSITYGAGATNLSRQLGITRNEAKDLIEQYFREFQGLSAYMQETVEFARANGYVTTLLGRKRTLRDINSNSGLARSNAERMAINTPIQGSAADMIKIAMINIHKEMEASDYKSKMILQVHDELVFDVHKDELEELQPMIEEKMKNAIPGLKVPIIVDSGIGDNWLQAH